MVPEENERRPPLPRLAIGWACSERTPDDGLQFPRAFGIVQRLCQPGHHATNPDQIDFAGVAERVVPVTYPKLRLGDAHGERREGGASHLSRIAANGHAQDRCQCHIQKCGVVDELWLLASQHKDFRDQGVRKEEALGAGPFDHRRYRWE